MSCGVYEIWIGDRFYQGSSLNVATRIAGHTSELRRGVHKNPIMQNAWNKHGSLEWWLLYECSDRHTALAHEQACLDANVDDPRCMNIARHAEAPGLGRKHTEAAKEKLRQYRTGRKASPEARQRMSAAKTGWCPSAVTRQRMSAAQTGKVLSAEHKARIGTANGRPCWGRPLGTAAWQRFPSREAAARHVGGTSGGVCACIKGKRNRHKGWQFTGETVMNYQQKEALKHRVLDAIYETVQGEMGDRFAQDVIDDLELAVRGAIEFADLGEED